MFFVFGVVLRVLHPFQNAKWSRVLVGEGTAM